MRDAGHRDLERLQRNLPGSGEDRRSAFAHYSNCVDRDPGRRVAGLKGETAPGSPGIVALHVAQNIFVAGVDCGCAVAAP